ncbi:TonB-dependent receptor [Sphingobium aquiterrae]|uniref:TonB-dependent receptor n=1 Tax=Sphingobium aquiterrae TaxID=2038656 RepID=UPI00301763DE
MLATTGLSGNLFPALAQTQSPEESADRSPNDIVITASKRAQTLVSVAAPVSVLSGDRIEKHGVTSFADLVDQIPGVSVNSDYGGSASRSISIRGVGATDDYRPNGSSSVAMHVDNIYQASNVFQTVPFFDVDRVEVLKGPQGTLYGRNSTGGVINLITRSKSDVLNGYADASVESYGRYRIEGAVGLPIAQGVGLRLAGTVDQGGGYQTAEGAGAFAGKVYYSVVGPVPDPGKQNGWGDRNLYAGRATLDIEPSSGTKLIVKLFGSRDRGEPIQQDSRGGVANSGWIEPDNDPYTFYSDRRQKKRIDIWGVSASLDQKLTDSIDLALVAGYQDGKRYFEGEGTGSPQRNLDFNFSDHIRQHSLEARVSQHDAGPIGWVVGGYYIHDRISFRTDLLALDVLGTNLLTDYAQTRTSKAAFGQLDWKLLDRLTLSGGLRYTKDDANYAGSTIDVDPFGISTAKAAVPGIPVVFDNDFSDDNVSGRLTLSYRPSDNSNIYVSYGTGYKAGGFDGSSIFSTPEALPFKSENVRAYEGGFKIAGTHGLFLNVDAFYYDFDNLQANTTQIFAGQQTTANIRTNVAKARDYGVDIAAGMTLVQSGPHRLSVDGGATLLSTRILAFDSSNPNLVAVNLGNDLPAAPHFSGNAQLTYNYDSGRGWNLTAAVDARRKSSEYKRLDNNEGGHAPGYTLLNARMDLAFTQQRITLFVYARNLTDRIYFTDLTATSRLAGAPRTIGGGVRFDF